MKLRHVLIRIVLAAILLAAEARAAAIFPTASTWRWRPGNTEASTPVEAWRVLGFADTQFVTAPAPFWYGDVLPGGTQITGMQGVYRSIFLRKTFVVTNLNEIGGLRLGALVDDGFVAWINGTEVQRVNVPGGTGSAVSAATTLADNAVEPVSFLSYNLPAPPSYLLTGTNVLAVQVFQSSLDSSDLGFECSLDSVLTETNPPTIVSVTPPPGTINSLGQITVTFSEPVTGVVAAHLLVNGIGATTVTPVNSSTYIFSFVQPPYGSVPITWNPAHTIADQALPPNRFNATGPGATWTYTLVDNTPPTVAGLSPAAGATVRTLTSITVLFSEGVTGVNAADLLINTIPASGVTPAAASQYTFTFPEPATGSVQVAWSGSHGITDQAAAPNAFAGGGWTYRLDPNALDAPPYISEFMASNTRTLADENGFFEDWIEIYNPGTVAVNLDGWYLTDTTNKLDKWRFPATNLAGGGFLVVFASGNDRRIPGARLHTDFQLSAGGEYLALVRPDGVTVASEFPSPFAPNFPDVSYGFPQVAAGNTLEAGTNRVYFTTPTPGAANLGGTAIPGPIIEEVQHTPNVPLDHEDLLVTARVRPSFRPIATVNMRYRIMFSNEVTTPMFDDGAHGDGAAGDGLYGATIPANLSTNGQMIRYLIAATDVNAGASRWPLFTAPANQAEYLGTIVNPTNLTSKLPIFHLFVGPTQLAGIDSEAGGRISFFYDGEFYDNVYMELRGNTSAGLAKKAHRLEFNRGHELRHAGPGGRTRKSSLLGEYLDPAYLRQHLCFWFLNNIGVPAPYDYPVRVQMNGAFYQLAFHNDVIGQEQVERMGYDPRGALYKAVGTFVPSFFSTGVFQKLEPDNDTSRTDYLQLATGIAESPNSVTNRRATVFDLLDLPQVINHLAGSRWCSENDDVWANMSMYRDTFGDGLWRNIPFDMNASWGQLYGGSNPLEATVDTSKSHPLYGGSSTAVGNWNRLYDVIVTLPETRQMLLRRQRTIMDQWIQPPETPAASLIIENYIKSMTNLISVEANLDRAKWGFSPWASGKTFDAGVGDLLNQFVGPRRRHWYVTHSITNTARPIGITSASNAGIPLAQPANVTIGIVEVDFNPAGGNQNQEYVSIVNPAPFAVDITGWKLDGAVNFTFAPGTVLPSNSVAYVSPDTRAFRARTTAPRGGQGLFVLGPYKGQLSARGEAVVVKNALGRTVNTFSYVGAPSPAQRYLRVTEIMFHPTALAGSQNLPDEFEYLELKNISTNTVLGLAGVRLVNGVDFSFAGSAITSLAPGARALVVKNTAAFTARYGAGLPVAGQFTGNLENDGERIQILDASNEEVLDFSYDDDWYPITDGLGFSLVVVDETAEPDSWNNKSQWRASGSLAGSPGAGDPQPPAAALAVVSEALTRTDVPPPLDTIELHNPAAQPADISGWWLTDDFNTPAKFRIPDGTSIAANGYITFDESHFNPGGAGFALSSDGDEIWLFSADAAGNLTGYVHGHTFGAAEDGVSFGRHITSDAREHFVAQTARSLGGANAGPRVGPVVINEIMYRPADFSGTHDNTDDEFIELLNLTGSPVPLFDPGLPTNTWRLRGGADFDFPANLTLAGGEFILLVNFSPTNNAMATAFRTKYGVSGGIRLFGPYEGNLDNSGDDVELKKPTTPVLGVVPYVLLDKVDYRDSAPWPAGADGYGLSLQRKTPTAFGNDPASWTATLPTAAATTSPAANAPAITAHPQSQSAVYNSPVNLSVTASGAPPLRYQWRFNGVNIPDATNSLLAFAAIQPEQAGDYSVAVFNGGGSEVSSNATVAVMVPAIILAQPQGAAVAPGANVTFSIIAYSPSLLTYQWRLNGTNLPGKTSSFLSIPNAGLADAGDYTVVVSDPISSFTSATASLVILIDPIIVAQPVSQSVIVGGPLTLSIAVTNTATLPIGFRLRRGSTTLPAGPNTFFTVNAHSFFLTLTGTNAAPPWTSYNFIVTNRVRTNGLLASAATITYLTDSDGDGLADLWETNNFGGLNAEPNLDEDDDKLTNWEEFIAGTDPGNALSYLKVDSISMTNPPSVSFLAISNRTYTLLVTNSLNGGWQKLADIVARATNRTETIPDPAAGPRRFYRLVTPRQP